MTITELIAVVVSIASFISSISVIYGKLLLPIKKFITETERNKEQIAELNDKLKDVHQELKDQNEYSSQNRAIVMRTMIAILDGLEQSGANGKVTIAKKELITYMSENLNGKK